MRAHVIPLVRLPANKGAFFYDASSAVSVSPGMLVRIAWRAGTVFGIVQSVDHEPTTGLKPLSSLVHPQTFLSAGQIESACDIAQFYHVNPGTIIKMMLPTLQPRSLPRLVLSETTATPLHDAPPTRYLWHAIPKNIDATCRTLQAYTRQLTVHILPTKTHITAVVRTIQECFPDQAVHTVTRDSAPRAVRETWRACRSNEPVWIFTTRHGAFLPFPEGTPVFLWHPQDEHHKSWDAIPYYNSLDVLRLRAIREHIAIHHVSHTASLEHVAALQRQEAQQEAPWQPKPINITVIDVIDEYRKKNFELTNETITPLLADASPKQQVLLLHNRKGYAQLLACKQCEREFPPDQTACPRCGSMNVRLIAKGIDALAGSLAKEFPNKRIVRCTAEDAQPDTLAQADIIIATDAAFTHVDFSQVAGVWIPYADRYLGRPWFSAVEDGLYFFRELRFHMRQDARLIVHTWHGEHPFWRALTDVGALRTLYAKELRDRETHGYPPQTYLLRVLTPPRGLPNTRVRATTYASELIKIPAQSWREETIAHAMRLSVDARIDPRPLPF